MSNRCRQLIRLQFVRRQAVPIDLYTMSKRKLRKRGEPFRAEIGIELKSPRVFQLFITIFTFQYISKYRGFLSVR